MLDRIPFDVAIADKNLLAGHFKTLSLPQQVVLKAFNGLPLSEEELVHWAVLQGSCTVDHLGYVTSVTPIAYKPQKYDELIAILGRRSGKTDRITATQIAYEALLGGHMRHAEKGQDVQILFIAQDIDMAASHLNFINNAIRSSPLLAKEVEKFNADAIVLKNGLKIVPAPPTIKSSRGLAVPGWCGDEVGFWYTDTKSANPDYEVERAVEYAMSQFPDSFKFITSTPYTKEGMLWEAKLAGTNGRLMAPDEREEYAGVLVCHASTAAMQNPRINQKRLVKLQKKDPEAFIRESLAQFVDSISGFLNPDLLRAAIARYTDGPEKGKGILERERLPRPGHPEDPTPVYIAAMDPAFRHDKFAFTIMHHSMEEGIVQDYFEEWTPELGVPLNPSDILAQIKLHLDRFGINVVYSDQHQLETIQQLAMNFGFTVIGTDFTSASKAKIYGNFASLVNQRRMKILDKPTIYDQLVALEKKITPNKTVQINAPPGKYDDAAAACCLCAFHCVWMLPSLAPVKPKVLSHVEEGLAQIKRKRIEALQEEEDY